MKLLKLKNPPYLGMKMIVLSEGKRGIVLFCSGVRDRKVGMVLNNLDLKQF